MGIDGLLTLLKPVTQKEHLSSFRRKRVAVDAKAWLYKGCYGYTFQLNQEAKTNQFMYYVIQMVQLLRHYQIDTILVFDGRSLEMKGQTNQKRKKIKQDNYEKGLKSLQNDEYLEAQKYFSRCIKIDQRIFSTALNCLRADNVKFMIAPYQADSQIAKLFQLGEIDVAITQDSDFLVYGCKVILKLNPIGDCDYVDLSAVNLEQHKQNIPLYNFLNMGLVDRMYACVLAGCDYLSNIRGIGLKTAISLLKKYQEIDQIIQELRKNKKMQGKIPQKYQDSVKKVQLIFVLAKVYNPKSQVLEYLKNTQEYNKIGLSKDQLDLIVGKDYDYTQTIRKGQIECNNLKPREIKNVDFKSFFLLDKNNLALQEIRHRMRNRQIIKKQEFSQEQIQQAKQMQMQLQKKLQQQRKKKEQQTKTRHNKLNSFLNSLVSFGDEEEQMKENEKQSLDILIQNQSSQQQSPPYQNLNPFLIKK